MFRIVILVLLSLAPACVYAQEPEKNESWYYLSNDGESTLMVKTPNYYSVPNTSEHIAILPFKTPVEVLAMKQDPALAILQWSQVKVLHGQHRGKTGWVSSRAVIKTNEPKPRMNVAESTTSHQKARMVIPSKYAEDRIGLVVSKTQLRTQPKIAIAEVNAPALPLQTQVRIISSDPKIEQFGLDFQWWNVEVISGDKKGVVGWILDQHIQIHGPFLPYDSKKAFEYADKYCSAGNDCSTGEYNSIMNPITLLSNIRSTDCAHFISHILYAAGVKVPGKAAKCKSGLAIRVAELKGWFRGAAKKYENVYEVSSWKDARIGDYCFLSTYSHVVLLNSKPKSDGSKIYGHSNNRCGSAVKFDVAGSKIFRIEEYPAKSP